MSKKDEYVIIIFLVLTIMSIYSVVYTINEVDLPQTIEKALN